MHEKVILTIQPSEYQIILGDGEQFLVVKSLTIEDTWHVKKEHMTLSIDLTWLPEPLPHFEKGDFMLKTRHSYNRCIDMIREYVRRK